ncbi:MAG: phospholipase D-like domain-containing protein [Myxococcota bacterium]
MPRDASHVPFVDSGSYPLRPGNRVRPLVDGAPAFARIAEAAEAAQHSVWVTVAFLDPEFEMPGGRGSFFDFLDRVHERGLDVRVLFWRHWQLHEFQPAAHFPGSEAQRRDLEGRGSRFLARWDQAHDRYCQHQKSWLVDAGHPTEVAFVGGINLNPGSVVVPGHPPSDGGNTHDVYVELQGPAACDVHHNFVQRWNEASDRGEPDGCWPDASSQDDLRFPEKPGPEAGPVPVQIQRTVRRDRYRNGHPAPDAPGHPIEAGEFSVVDQYRRALDAAQETIYIEDQAIGAPEIVDRLQAALSRGVHVGFLVPLDPNNEMAAARGQEGSQPFWDSLAALGEHPHFTLAGIAASRGPADLQHVYVHAKIALVDDSWATIGSANVGNRSFYGDTELNASFWHGPTVRALRDELFGEHLGRDTSQLSGPEALALFARQSRENATRRDQGKPLDGLALWIDPARYAL